MLVHHELIKQLIEIRPESKEFQGTVTTNKQ